MAPEVDVQHLLHGLVHVEGLVLAVQSFILLDELMRVLSWRCRALYKALQNTQRIAAADSGCSNIWR